MKARSMGIRKKAKRYGKKRNSKKIAPVMRKKVKKIMMDCEESKHIYYSGVNNWTTGIVALVDQSTTLSGNGYVLIVTYPARGTNYNARIGNQIDNCRFSGYIRVSYNNVSSGARMLWKLRLIIFTVKVGVADDTTPAIESFFEDGRFDVYDQPTNKRIVTVLKDKKFTMRTQYQANSTHQLQATRDIYFSKKLGKVTMIADGIKPTLTKNQIYYTLIASAEGVDTQAPGLFKAAPNMKLTYKDC